MIGDFITLRIQTNSLSRSPLPAAHLSSLLPFFPGYLSSLSMFSCVHLSLPLPCSSSLDSFLPLLLFCLCPPLSSPPYVHLSLNFLGSSFPLLPVTPSSPHLLILSRENLWEKSPSVSPLSAREKEERVEEVLYSFKTQFSLFQFLLYFSSPHPPTPSLI